MQENQHALFATMDLRISHLSENIVSSTIKRLEIEGWMKRFLKEGRDLVGFSEMAKENAGQDPANVILTMRLFLTMSENCVSIRMPVPINPIASSSIRKDRVKMHGNRTDARLQRSVVL